MAIRTYGASGLIGGAAGDLDLIDGAALADQDMAQAITATGAYNYILDDDSGAAESSPDIITPDTNAGTKRWVLVSQSDQDTSVAAAPTFAGGEFTATVAGISPVAGADLVTKEYADALMGTFKTFFISDTASGVGALEYAYPQETGGVESTIVTAALSTADDQLINGWITEAGEPGTTTIHAGVMDFHVHAKKGAANHKDTQLYYVLSSVDADGTTNKTTLCTSEVGELLTDAAVSYHLHGVVSADAEIAVTARLILDVYANVGAGSTDSVVTLYMEGTKDSYWTARVDGGIWQAQSDGLDGISATTATAAELDELTDGSTTTLHDHAGSSDVKVGVDAAATAGYLGAASSDGVLRTGAGLSYTDGGDFVTVAVTGTYVDRGDPSVHDYTNAFTTDGTWYDLDLSSVVPAGAIAVSLFVYLVDDATGSTLIFRKNGNSNEVNVSSCVTKIINTAFSFDVITVLDSNRVIEYKATNTTWTTIIVSVKGWWI